MQHKYKTHGVCSREININIDDGIIKDVKFVDGCNGNLQGIGALVKGQRVENVINTLRGIKCKTKETSCPDQLALALIEAKTLIEAKANEENFKRKEEKSSKKFIKKDFKKQNS